MRRHHITAPRLGLAAILLLVAALTALSGCAQKVARAPKDKYAGLTAQQIYDIAVKRMEKKSYTSARDVMQKALGRTDATPELIAKIHLVLADAYFYDGGLLNLAEALSRYTNFLTFYPNHDRADYAQYQLGLCYLKQAANPDRDQTQTRKALAELTKVESLYPGSEYVGEAHQSADEAREILAEHSFRIGAFYYRRDSYPGAVERFRDVLESHPHYSRKDRVYLLLGKSLLALDKRDEGQVYLEKLLAEFPQSKHAGEARALLERPVQTAVGSR